MSDSMTPPPQPSGGEASLADPLVGTTLLGRVKIVAPIGRGGMGRVYLGEQTRLRRRCAVKVLDPALARRAGADFSRRFLLEASVVARIAHPHVVTVFEYGETPGGQCFIAMEYLEGRTVADELRSGPMAPARAVHVAQQVCKGLQAAHARGVVHGDVKPANLFLVHRDGDRDFVKVLDFGLVRDMQRSDGGDVGAGDAILGSPRYMSPEQVQGKEIDARSDVYSTGATLYAMLAGRPPFERRTELATMMAQVSAPPPAFAEAAPQIAVPQGLEAVVMKCLAKDPDQRWASIAELGAALRLGGVAESTHDDDEVGGAPPKAAVPDTIPSTRLRSRRRARIAAVAAAAVAGLGLMLVALRSRSVTRAEGPSLARPSEVAVPEQTAVVHVESDPPGARVKEEGNALCEATPCDIVYRGAAADPATEHLIALLLPGYKLERAIAKAPSAVRVKLTKSQ